MTPAIAIVDMPVDRPQPEATAKLTVLPRWVKWGVAVMLAIHACLLGYGAWAHSPTYNEPAHLVAGISYWELRRFDIYSVNPPLVRMVAAAPVLFAGCETDWHSLRDGPGSRLEMTMGSDFCEANGSRVVWLVTLARWACIPFCLLGGYICFRWGNELYGPAAGLLSLMLWCFCPNIIAHGQLITCDAAATALGVAACYQFWHWLKAPTLGNTLFSGFVLGLAELTKTTLLIFYPLWPLLWLIYRWPDRKHMVATDWLREFGLLWLRAIIGLYVINVGYGFEDSLTPLGEFKFVSQSLTGLSDTNGARIIGNRFADSWWGQMPVPLPKQYVIGIDLQRRDFESYNTEFYLGGAWSKNGWWYYYLYALAIKVPLGTWLLLAVAVVGRFWFGSTARLRDEFFLLAPAIVILLFVSSQTGMNEHMRYVLPIFPFVFIWLGSVTAHRAVLSTTATTHGAVVRRAGPCLIAIAVAWSTASSLWCFPHSLSYFNEIIGGSKNGWKYLVNSNLDWGQDLLFLKSWTDQHPQAKPLRIALFGTINPKLVGIDGVVMSPADKKTELAPGYYAFSSTILAGFGQPQHTNQLKVDIEQGQPYETVGGSIVVVEVR